MRIPRIFYDGELSSDKTVILSGKELHYIKNVLRRKDGDNLELFNNFADNFLGIISSINNKIVSIDLIKSIEKETESPLYTELGMCLIKSDKMDLAIQKAVELGVNSIVPIDSDRCNINLRRIENKIRHWDGIIKSACAQSDRIKIPLISSPVKLHEWVDNSNGYDSVYFDPYSNNTINAMKFSSGKIRLLIGPEGGFTDPELNLLDRFNWLKVSLGRRILRSETAAIAALTLIQNSNGDM